MIVHTEVDKVEDGAITAVTLKVMDGDTVIQQCSFDILEEGTIAKAIKNRFQNGLDEEQIKKSFVEIKKHLRDQGVEEVMIESYNLDW